MATDLNDTVAILGNVLSKARLYNYNNTNVNEAKQLLLRIHKNEFGFPKTSTLYNELSSIYVWSNQIDSAKLYAKMFDLKNNPIDTIKYHLMYEQIAITEGNYKDAYNHNKT